MELQLKVSLIEFNYRINLILHSQKLATLREANGMESVAQLLVLFNLLTRILDLLIRMHEIAALVILDHVPSNLQALYVNAINLRLEDLLHLSQGKGEATGIAHSMPQNDWTGRVQEQYLSHEQNNNHGTKDLHFVKLSAQIESELEWSIFLLSLPAGTVQLELIKRHSRDRYIEAGVPIQTHPYRIRSSKWNGILNYHDFPFQFPQSDRSVRITEEYVKQLQQTNKMQIKVELSTNRPSLCFYSFSFK